MTKRRNNRTTGNRSGRDQGVEDSFPDIDELVARAIEYIH